MSDDRRRPDNRGAPRGGVRSEGNHPTPRRERGGLATQGPRKVAAAPKRQRTLIIGDNKPSTIRTKMLRASDVRLKVRNIDEKQVTNDDLKKLFQKIGELKVCRFDRNEFGQFLGSATVTYERPGDAKQAISEYHGAFLDDKVLTVEFDMVPQIAKIVKPDSARSGNNRRPMGKTLRVRQ